MRRLLPLVLLPLTAVSTVSAVTGASADPAMITLSLHAETPTGELPGNGSVSVMTAGGVFVTNFGLDSLGNAQVTVPAGSYYFETFLRIAPVTVNEQRWTVESDVLELTTSQSIDLTPPGHVVTVDLTDEETSADVAATGTLTCRGQRTLTQRVARVDRVADKVDLVDGALTIAIPEMDADPEACSLRLKRPDGTRFVRVFGAETTSLVDTVAPGSLFFGAVKNNGTPAQGGQFEVRLDNTSRTLVDQMQLNPNEQSFGYGFRLEHGDYRYSYSGGNQGGLAYSGTGQVSLTGQLNRQLGPSPRPLTIKTQDASTAPVDTSMNVTCEGPDTYGGTQKFSYQRTTSAAGGGATSAFGLDNGTTPEACEIVATRVGSPTQRVRVNAPSPTDNETTLVFPVLTPVTGTVSDGLGGTLTAQYPFIGKVEAAIDAPVEPEFGGQTPYDLTTGAYSLPATPGADVRFSVVGSSSNYYLFTIQTDFVTVTPGLDIDFALDPAQLDIRVLKADGSPGRADVLLDCERDGDDPHIDLQRSRNYGIVTGSARFAGLAGLDGSGDPGCTVTVTPPLEPPFPPPYSKKFTLTPGGPNKIVVLPASRAILVDDAVVSTDEDGVPDLVEAQGPNGGDGNDDGIPDYEQDNVTSLPGGGGGAGDAYVTIEGPADATLAGVSTLARNDPSVTTAPPAGLALPDGLVRFRLEDLAPGATRTVSIYSSSTAGLTGYAKYHDNTWTALPADRVAITGQRVDITLTDGGIGDDDGASDGTIVDPGGPSFTDTTAPVVGIGGVTAGKTYVLGAVPAATCAASDAGGLADPCQLTVTGGNAAGVGSFVARARAVDHAGNQTVVTKAYKVAYRFGGFLAPVAKGSKPQVLKAGKKIKVKFRILRANGTVAKPAAALRWMKPERGAKLTKPAPKSWKGTSPTGSAFARSGDAWAYDWATKKLKPGYWYRIGVRLDDGTTQYVVVGLKKPKK